MKKFFTKINLVLLMVVALFSASVLSGCKNKGNEFVIGMSGPLTGGAAVYGLAVQKSAEMAVEEINALGGLNGYKFKLVATDDMHDPSKVSTNYASLMKQGMNFSLGCVTTKPCLEFKNLSKDDNLFFITPSATNDSVPEFANGYQMCFADTKQGTFSAQYINSNYEAGSLTIGVLYRAGDDYSQGIYQNFIDAIDTTKFGNVVVASFNEENPSSLESQVQSLRNCTLVFLPIYYTPASTFMTQAKDIISPNCVYFGCDGLDGIDGIQGFDINTIPQEISYLSHFNSNATTGLAKEFIDKYTAKNGKDTLNQFGASAYDCVYAIYNALKKAVEAGKNVTPKTSVSELCEILKEEFKTLSFNGVTGNNISWDSSGFVNKEAVKYIVKEKNS